MMATTSKCDTRSEYIERNKEYELIGQTGVAKMHVSDIDAIQAADVAPVQHGRWVLLSKGACTSVYECSLCKLRVAIASDQDKANEYLKKFFPYCNCGAKMDI